MNETPKAQQPQQKQTNKNTETTQPQEEEKSGCWLKKNGDVGFCTERSSVLSVLSAVRF